MRPESFDRCALRGPLHNMPDRFRRDPITPDPTEPVYSAEDRTRADASSHGPLVDSLLHPCWHGNCPDVLSFADQVGDDPVFLPNLKIFGPQCHQFCSSEPAPDQQRQNRAVPFPS